MTLRLSEPRVVSWLAPQRPARIEFAVSGGSPQEFEAAIAAIKRGWAWPSQRMYDSETHRWTVEVTEEAQVERLAGLFANFAEHWTTWVTQLSLF